MVYNPQIGLTFVFFFCFLSEITGVEPSSGSMEGGTLLTISGNYFDTYSETTVLVGGKLCSNELIIVNDIQETVLNGVLHNNKCATNNMILKNSTHLFEMVPKPTRFDNQIAAQNSELKCFSEN